MDLPGGLSVRYACMGCERKISHEEHTRNLTVDKFTMVPMVEGMAPIEHTMTVILCDECKPKWDAIVTERGDKDALAVIECMKGGDDDGATG